MFVCVWKEGGLEGVGTRDMWGGNPKTFGNH